MLRSLSGDTVIALPIGYHLKFGSPEVGRQAIVMRKVNALLPGIVPAIPWAGERWYTVKTMDDAEYFLSKLTPHAIVRLAVKELEKVWALDEGELFYAPSFKVWALAGYLEDRKAHYLLRRMETMFFDVYQNASEATHGDCTLENTVFGRSLSDTVAFIDWLPYRRVFIPAHRDVDYGKIIQGLLGWKPTNFSRDPHRLKPIRWILEQCPYAAFWACVHYERIKARTGNPGIHVLCDMNIKFLLNN